MSSSSSSWMLFDYCSNPICTGDGCAFFSDWHISGLSTDISTLYCTLTVVGIEQQVELFLDEQHLNKIASGSSETSPINFSQVDGSGVSGSVVWDGSYLDYPQIVLTCPVSSTSSLVYSSNSSHSRLSNSSSSSLSTSSVEISSESTLSTSSSFYDSSLSSSSTTSKDSNSSSSEMITSSSTMSFVDEWNKVKPLVLGDTAISGISINNKLAQSIKIIDNYYSIGNVYCYFYKANGEDTSYNINMGFYTCNNDGTPQTLLQLRTISASEVTEDNWYPFPFDVTGTTPSNGYLSFVVWQDGGDQDNYILWGYAKNNSFPDAKAWLTYDGVTWSEYPSAMRSLKITSDFDPFNFSEGEVVTPPGEDKQLNDQFDNPEASFNGTIINSDGEVVIDPPNIIASFVIDSSGSMGWNDRFSNRIDVANKIIEKIKNEYLGKSLFDIIKFGAVEASVNSVSSNVGQEASIKVDLTNPSLSPYIFTVSNSSASEGTIYTDLSGNTFIVLQTVSNGDSLACNGSTDADTTGELTLTSGTGDLTIYYSAFDKKTIKNSRIISFGFKNFEPAHTYNLGDIKLDNATSLNNLTLSRWQEFKPNNEVSSLTEGNSGDSKGGSSIDILSSENLLTRNVIGSSPIISSQIIEKVSSGSTIVKVNDVSSFSSVSTIDITDGNKSNLARSITGIDSFNNTITFTPAAEFDVLNYSNGGGIIQSSNSLSAQSLGGTTLSVMMRDVNTTRNIDLFFQTDDGYLLEWSLKPLVEWSLVSAYWLDETAVLPISIFKTDGSPFENGTQIDVYVDNPPKTLTDSKSKSSSVSKIAAIGSTRIYFTSTTLVRNQMVDILDNNGHVQTSTIESVGEDSDGIYIDILDPLTFELNPENGGRVIVNTVSNSQLSLNSGNQSQFTASLSLVNVTPIYENEDLPTSLLKPYDIEQVPKGTSYEDLNFATQWTQNQIKDIPSINGSGVIRVLPITEDNLQTVKTKKDKISLVFNANSEQPPAQLPTQTGDSNTGATSSTSQTTVVKGVDYTIESPVYLLNGIAKTSMTSSSLTFSEMTIPGLNFPAVPDGEPILAKKYEIYPVMTLKTKTGGEIAKQYFDPFEVYFTPPVLIYRERDDNTVAFYSEAKGGSEDCQTFQGYYKHYLPGVYASGNGFKINYVISNKFVLVSNGQLQIRIYTNKIIDLDGFASNNEAKNLSSQAINTPLPSITTSVNGVQTVTAQKSSIDTWRDLVSNNPADGILTDNSVNQTNVGYSEINSREAEAAAQYAELIGGSTQSKSTKVSPAGFYENPSQWTYAKQYTSYDFTIPIVNGKATLEIPSSDIVSLLMVEASMPFGEGFEAVAMDYVFVANPIIVEDITPNKVTPTEGQLYEIGTNISWKDGIEGVIEDNTQVSFSFQSTPAAPSSSVTDNGWAGGVFVGPHAPIIFEPPSNTQDVVCPPEGITEEITVQVFHSVYSRTVKRKILWGGSQSEEGADGQSRKFYFHATPSTASSWSDGSQYPATEILADLDDGYNESPEWVGDDGIRRLKGEGQKNNLPRMVYGSPTTPSKISWNTGKISLISSPLNQNIGYPQPVYEGEKPAVPWKREIQLTTSYFDESGHMWFGDGLEGLPYPDKSGTLILPKVTVNFAEPLGIEMSMEAPFFTRNGVSSPILVADVTWKGKSITPFFTFNEGTPYETTIQYPLPIVTFKSGTFGKGNSTGGEDAKYVDTRNKMDGCLTVIPNRNALLNSYTSQVSLSRTSVYTSGGNQHKHICSVDLDGNGATTSVINIVGFTEDHIHTITNYSVEESLIHSHEVRSVAITQILPTTETQTDFVVNGYVIYDPTKCLPYGNEANNPDGNRMMFSTITLKGTAPVLKELNVKIFTGSDLSHNSQYPSGGAATFYTAKTPGDTNRGFDIGVYVEWSEYTNEVSPGIFEIVPAQPIDDGTRITFEISTFLPPQTATSETLTMVPGASKNLMTLKVKAMVSVEDQVAMGEAKIVIASNNQWIPDVESLVPELTNDSIYLSNALGKIGSFGSSQIYDGIVLAANRIIQAQNDNIDLKKYKKMIFVLTDGDENTSQYSLKQAIDAINSIEGFDSCPIMPIKLGKTYPSDDLSLQIMAQQTNSKSNGVINEVKDYSSIQLDTLVDYMFENQNIAANSGTYTSIFSFGQEVLPSQIEIPEPVIPSGASAQYRVATSLDGIVWNTWSEWTTVENPIPFDQISTSPTGDAAPSDTTPATIKYIKYEISLNGNSNFETPLITKPPKLTYAKHHEFVLFYSPINVDMKTDEYISSIMVTHEADIPPTSIVTYGFTQSDSIDPDDYIELKSDQHTVLPTRYNEVLFTDDFRVYVAENGRWSSSSTIQVYKINPSLSNGVLIDSSLYSFNPKEGTVTFLNSQSITDTFMICIEFPPSFRLICNTKNTSTESAVIHHVAVMYNITKRIPTDSNGNIVNKPISLILPSLNSSSSSLSG